MQVILAGKDGNAATVRTAGGSTFPLPPSLVPTQCAPGDTFGLDLEMAEKAAMPGVDRAHLAKVMLNELLRSA